MVYPLLSGQLKKLCHTRDNVLNVKYDNLIYKLDERKGSSFVVA